MDVAVVSACLPTMRPLLQAVFPTTLMTKLYGSGSKSKRGNAASKDPYFKMSPRRQYGEDFQRLPDHSINTMAFGSGTEMEAGREINEATIYGKHII